MSERAYDVIVPSLPFHEAVKLGEKIENGLGYGSVVLREVEPRQVHGYFVKERPDDAHAWVIARDDGTEIIALPYDLPELVVKAIRHVIEEEAR